MNELEKVCDKMNLDSGNVRNEHWDKISAFQTLSESFIEKHSDKVDWDKISMSQKLSEIFIEKHSEKVNWDRISTFQKLSETFIAKYADKIDWYYTSMGQKLSEKLIEKHSDKVDWDIISKYQKLSESFIEKHSDKVDWYSISKYQKLGESFIEKYVDRVDWVNISKYQKLSEKLIEKHSLTIDNDNWLFWSTKEKENYIKKNTEYEIKDNKILAHKSIRLDNYSIYNFQYKYEVGKTYESHCDFRSNENSFGLSAWDKEGAINYYSEGKLILVEIETKDIGRIVHDNNKIRTKKFKVIEEIT